MQDPRLGPDRATQSRVLPAFLTMHDEGSRSHHDSHVNRSEKGAHP